MHLFLKSRLLGGSQCFALLALCGLVLCGCGGGTQRIPKSAVVSGKVTSGGSPVAEGMISFMSGQSAGSTPLMADGAYLIGENVPPGVYTVIVTPPPVTKPPMIGEAGPEVNPYKNIPEKYRGEGTSPLKVNVKEGENKFDFDLK